MFNYILNNEETFQIIKFISIFLKFDQTWKYLISNNINLLVNNIYLMHIKKGHATVRNLFRK